MIDYEEDPRQRPDKPGEYRIGSVSENGSIVCSRPGVQLIDFYRTQRELAKDVKPKETTV